MKGEKIMNKKKVFVSFDYDNDKNYYYLMKAWDKNKSFEFAFSDYTAKEIDSDDPDVVKRVLSQKIGESNYTLVLIGKEARKKHKDSNKIGYNNWQSYEIAKSIERGNKLVAVKLDKTFEAPDELYNAGAAWAIFEEESITNALDKA